MQGKYTVTLIPGDGMFTIPTTERMEINVKQVLDLKLASLSKISTQLPTYVTLMVFCVHLSYHDNQVPVQWEEVSVTPVLKGGKTVIPDSAIQSVKKNTVALKGVYPSSYN